MKLIVTFHDADVPDELDHRELGRQFHKKAEELGISHGNDEYADIHLSFWDEE